jgi:DNA-directed RNA polymerase specialized sigma subunit
LDAQCRNADSEITLVEMITAPEAEPHDPLIEELPRLLARLNERSRSLLVLYYGLGERKAISFAHIGKIMNLSQSRVGQLIAVAHQELRREVEA